MAVGAVFLLCVAGVVYLTIYLQWEARETGGNAYYRRPLAERRALKRRMRWYSLPALPLVHLFAALARKRATMPAFEFEGVSGPPKVSSAGGLRARERPTSRGRRMCSSRRRCAAARPGCSRWCIRS